MRAAARRAARAANGSTRAPNLQVALVVVRVVPRLRARAARAAALRRVERFVRCDPFRHVACDDLVDDRVAPARPERLEREVLRAVREALVDDEGDAQLDAELGEHRALRDERADERLVASVRTTSEFWVHRERPDSRFVMLTHILVSRVVMLRASPLSET